MICFLKSNKEIKVDNLNQPNDNLMMLNTFDVKYVAALSYPNIGRRSFANS